MPNLIILDIYGTIVKSDERDGEVRRGLIEFLDFYKDKVIVVFSDGDKERIEQVLGIADLSERFDGVYTGEDMKYVEGHNIKNLEKICTEAGIPNSDAVFIGDNFVGRDERSAIKYGIKFKKVPQFRSKPPDFRDRDYHGEYVDYENPENPFNFKDWIGKL